MLKVLKILFFHVYIPIRVGPKRTHLFLREIGQFWDWTCAVAHLGVCSRIWPRTLDSFLPDLHAQCALAHLGGVLLISSFLSLSALLSVDPQTQSQLNPWVFTQTSKLHNSLNSFQNIYIARNHSFVSGMHLFSSLFCFFKCCICHHLTNKKKTCMRSRTDAEVCSVMCTLRNRVCISLLQHHLP